MTDTARVERMFADRQAYESLWETVYRFSLPERAQFFKGSVKTPTDVSEEVFDSTAINAAERLSNLLANGVAPPWMDWGRLEPGVEITDEATVEQLRPVLKQAERVIFARLRRSSFYGEFQPTMLDRTVGGTACLRRTRGPDGWRYLNVPLSEVALQEDDAGQAIAVARRYKLSYRSITRMYDPPAVWKASHERDPDTVKHEICELDEVDVAGVWTWTVWLKDGGHELRKTTTPLRTMIPTRWSKVPGSPYGRSPCMRALSDNRALQKIKELSLKNAAKAVAGVYTVVDDGVINPYTLSIEPGTFITVASNNPNEPSIAELPASGAFDVSMFSMDELRNAIQQALMADQFQPLGRTPLSATEVAERTRVLAQDAAGTIVRLHHEVMVEILRGEMWLLQQAGVLPAALDLDGRAVKVEFVSNLSQAQWALDEQARTSYIEVAAAVGQIDPRGGMVADMEAIMRRLAVIKGIPPEELRTRQQIDEAIEQAAEAQATNEEAAGGVE